MACKKECSERKEIHDWYEFNRQKWKDEKKWMRWKWCVCELNLHMDRAMAWKIFKMSKKLTSFVCVCVKKNRHWVFIEIADYHSHIFSLYFVPIHE